MRRQARRDLKAQRHSQAGPLSLLPQRLAYVFRRRRQSSQHCARVFAPGQSSRWVQKDQSWNHESQTAWCERRWPIRPRPLPNSNASMHVVCARLVSGRDSAPAGAQGSPGQKEVECEATSKFSVAHFEMRWLVQSRAAGCNPGRGPVDHLLRCYRRTSEYLMSFCRVTQKGGGHFLANESWLHIKSTAKFFGNKLNAQSFRSGQIQNQRRSLAMREGTQANGIRVSLPNDIHERHMKIDGPSLKNRRADGEQHAVAKINRIIQSKNSNRRAPLARAVLKHTFSAEC